MAVMAPVPAPQAPRAPTCLLQTSAQAAEPLLSSLTRPPARSRSRLRPCAPVSRETGEHAFISTGMHYFDRWIITLKIQSGTATLAD